MFGETRRRMIVVGGGIGGLSAALALAGNGLACAVVEQADNFTAIGAGLQLGPNAVHILRELGVAERLEAAVAAPQGIHVLDALSGDSLTSIPLGAQAELRYGAPYWVVHRADLHAALLAGVNECDTITVRTSFRLEAINAEDTQISAVSQSGESVAGGALIGADGLWSRVRSEIAPGIAPSYAGKTAWRAVVPADTSPPVFHHDAIGLWLSPGAHLVHYPVARGTLINLVLVIAEPAPASDAQAKQRPDTRSHLDGWPEAVVEFLAAHDDWTRWPLYRMAPLPRWSQKRIGLLGDAAHPLLPFLASGGALAIEDAAALAKAMVSSRGNVAAGFNAYEKARRPRALKVQKRSERMGRVYHMGGLMRWARNQVIMTRAPEQHLQQNDWLYGYRPA
jgi:salicylate hydroxylase